MGKVEGEMRFLPHFEEPVQEEAVQPQSKVHFERNCLVEMQKEEMIWNLWSGVCSWHEEFIPERKCVLEMEKEEVFVSKDLEKVHSSLISHDENPVPKRIASLIQETEATDLFQSPFHGN